MAGRLGCGGGPLRLFPPLGGRKPMMLEKAEGDQRQQGMPVQPAPGAALEVIETEFLFQLLMRLLADPAGLDRRREGLQGRAGGMAGEIVLPLAAAAPLAHQPQLITGQAVSGLRLIPIRDFADSDVT